MLLVVVIDRDYIICFYFLFEPIMALIFILSFTPFLAQFALLIDTGFDLDEFQMRYSYSTRESYQELVDAINRLGYSDNLVILSMVRVLLSII